MDTLQKMEKPQSGSLLSRPVNPVVTGTVLLVVIVLFFSLWLQTTSQYARRARHARETAMKVILHELRNAIEQFHIDTRRNPLVLTDLVAPDAQHLRTPVKKGSYQGLYLTPQGGINNSGVPWNPLAKDAGDQPTDVMVNHSWRYDAKTGQIHSAVPGRSLDGKRYEEL